MDLYVPSSPCASRKLVAVAFLTFRHHIPFLLLLLLSKRPSALLKLSKGVIFTPIASTDARGVHRHQAIVILSLYHSKRIHCLLPKAALLNVQSAYKRGGTGTGNSHFLRFSSLPDKDSHKQNGGQNQQPLSTRHFYTL